LVLDLTSPLTRNDRVDRTQRKPVGGRRYGVDVTERTGMVALRDEDLVERAAGGDVDAFEVLVALWLNRAFRTASAILGSEADAYDVVQEASDFFAVDRAYLASCGPERDGTSFRAAEAVREGVAAFLSTSPMPGIPICGCSQRVIELPLNGRSPGPGPTASVLPTVDADLFEFEGKRIRVKDAFRKERGMAITARRTRSTAPA
jgi:hypothetical protein